jgi:hypothetical protein
VDGPANASPDDQHDQPLDASLLPSQPLTVEALRRPLEFAQTTATAASLRALARRIQLLDAETAQHTRAITTLVRAWRPELLTRTGVGPIVAAAVLCA